MQTETTEITRASVDWEFGSDAVNVLLDVATWMDALTDPPGEEAYTVENTGGGVFCIFVRRPFEHRGRVDNGLIDICWDAMGEGDDVIWRIGLYDADGDVLTDEYHLEAYREVVAHGPIEEVARTLVAETEAFIAEFDHE